MKSSKNIIFNLLVLFSMFQSVAQSVPVRSAAADQLAPGPCYIFATIAAVESLVMQKTGKMYDLSEWYFYSSCVQNGIGNGRYLMENTLNKINNDGAPLQGSSYSPSTLSACPNANTYGSECYMDLPPLCCHPKKSFEIEALGGGACTPSNSDFDVVSANYDVMFDMSAGTSLFKEIDLSGDRRRAIKDVLDGNVPGGEKGVIAFFQANAIKHGSEWRDSDHAIFFYGYGNGTWKYKDSWQGDAGLKTALDSEINFAGMTGGFYLTAEITDLTETEPEPVVEDTCESFITPNVSVYSGGNSFVNPNFNLNVCLAEGSTIRVTDSEIANHCSDQLTWGVSGRAGSIANSSTIQLVSSGSTASVEVLQAGSYTVWVEHRGLDGSVSPKRNVYLKYEFGNCGLGGL